MTTANLALLVAATTAFVGAASSAKSWAVSSGSLAWLFLTLGLYTVGNLVMLRLVREMGMAVALSLSAMIQLAAISLLAVTVFDERLSLQQVVGVALALVAIALITLPEGGR